MSVVVIYYSNLLYNDINYYNNERTKLFIVYNFVVLSIKLCISVCKFHLVVAFRIGLYD